ncbi:MAG: GAF domain-containing protein [Candidatus Aminicenantes bacterium]|nr:MAG: GAF domain-containing protein [Candidatus Aminicenantes bacterium]
MKLICLEGKEKSHIWRLTEARTVIGRDASCDIVIDDPGLSRIHAEIIHEGDAFVFYDRDSRNGSYVNNTRVTRQTLIPDDLIKMGSTMIKILKDALATKIKWKEGKSLIASAIPLDLLTHQIREKTTSFKLIPKKDTKIPAKVRASAEKLLKPVSPKITKVPLKMHASAEKLLQNLKVIHEVGNVINSIQTIDELLNQIAEKLLDVFPDVQSVCILFKEKGQDFEPKCIKNRADVLLDSPQVSRSIINKAIDERVCILGNDASHDRRFLASKSIAAMKLRSFMCAPLISKETVLGMIYLDNREKPSCFDEDDVTLLSALANQSAIAIENSQLYENIQKAYHEAILALLNTVEAKDLYTRGHSQRVSHYANGIAREMKLSQEQCNKITMAAELHDIGKIGVKEQIIGKETALSKAEYHSIKDHVLTGENILSPIEYLSFALPMIRGHHEHFDGSGYPDGLKEDDIPVGARILAVADTFDAITTQRPYNKPLPFKKALEKCEALKGEQLDPDVVDALVRFITKNYKIDTQKLKDTKS